MYLLGNKLCDTYCNIYREAMQKDRDAEDLERQVEKRRIFVTLFSVWPLITSNIPGLSTINRNTSKLCIWNQKCVTNLKKQKAFVDKTLVKPQLLLSGCGDWAECAWSLWRSPLQRATKVTFSHQNTNTKYKIQIKMPKISVECSGI